MGTIRGALMAMCLWPAGAIADITGARFSEPTTRYAHGVLGDAVEWGALEITRRGKPLITIRLPQSRVFEDLAPRLIDVTADGKLEVVVIESSVTHGARLAIYNDKGLLAATPFIGTTHRWLAPLGGADLDGDGFVELAYVDRPHLAKTLRIWRFQDGQLSEVAQAAGHTNHRIGQDFISGGIRDCGDGPRMITADAGWHYILETQFSEGRLTTRRIAQFGGPPVLIPL